MAVTMKDVAKQAGVSTTTVSHVINSTRFVSPKVREHVMAVMSELSYQPNAIAKSLRQKSTNTIGLVISDISNPFFTSLIRGVEDAVTKKGYNLILCSTDENPVKEKTAMEVLMQKQVDGMIMAPTGGNIEYLSDLVARKYPLVFVDRFLDGVHAPVAQVDNQDGAYRAVTHLIGLGHRRIGLITGLPALSSTRERLAGYNRALADHGLPPCPELIFQANSQVDGGMAGARYFFGLSEPPTAIFAANNLMTIGVMKALHAAGLTCPQDMAVVGFDDFDWASAFRPLLTTVAQPVYEVGKAAADLVLARLQKKARLASAVVLKGTLIIRESCGALLSASAR